MGKTSHLVCAGLTLGLWSIWPRMIVLALVASALAALLLLNIFKRWGRPASDLTAGSRWLILILGMASFCYRWHRDDSGSFSYIVRGTLTRQKERLTGYLDNQLWPRRLTDDRPTRVIGLFADSQRVRWKFSESTSFEGVPLGGGLFAFDINPDQIEWPNLVRGTLDTLFEVDSIVVPRCIDFVRQAPRLRSLEMSPDGTAAAAVSRESDKLVVLSPGQAPLELTTPSKPTVVRWLANGDELLIGRAGQGSLISVTYFQGRGLSGRELTLWSAGMRLQDREHNDCLDTSPDGSLVVALVDGPGDELQVHDRAFGVSYGSLDFDGRASRVMFGRDQTELFVELERPAEIRRVFIDKRSLYESDGLLLSRPVFCWSMMGSHLVVGSSGYDPSGRHLEGNHFVDDTLLLIDPADMTVQHSMSTNHNTEANEHERLGSGIGPTDLHPSKNGGLAVLFSGSREIQYYDKNLKFQSRVDTEKRESSWPREFVELKEGDLIVNFPALGRLSTGLGSSWSSRPEWWTDDARRRGEDLFYVGTHRRISCHSCHPHGGSDGARHDLGGVLKDHITLPVYGLTGSSPFLRDASKGNLGDFHSVLTKTYRGTKVTVSQTPEKDMHVYLDSLPPRTNPYPIAKDVQAGYKAFLIAKCNSCHVPPMFTNQERFPANYLFAKDWAKRPRTRLDVPTLHDLGHLAPYFIDGRSPSLLDALWKRRDGTRHGQVDRLSREEMDALIRFLESL